ncbi:hypothetical protein A3D81_00750 [Candidatus Curtissbacteria bacterium RIFCSPHIGHO2_02_FULL_40_17]|uniref:GIY-YIG domain-containing protein n=4 Tax=Patescibacteria group TaxID=1783273 RepID=A0A1G2HGD5_9BACT|nr:MAG: hypothetical protein A3D81_00750 [Candidatus Curtissbacteria bacterium RIFCSPHIGHO2_02_FULL_40_17]OGE03843.1 MAG: hypothetical protein A3F45_01065 [Candidatus Curtissbacteria bacterium RIFCSPHIGHO2_12_FULL_41_17]OGE05920.1 MAG: hypothetical protein A3I53_02240 [Candidatus Curtissbacteria bacterium RIFCSPLOWO2_02_FULL_40_13b]OGZ58926.1 MAG: hypothetical protein A2728_02020 [Candidatus Spechtbacteria bacterium RIFCSPHIGHO2_01_FULL_38_11]OGZ61552.1 MAG: hypothetical protein A3F94_00220 [Ca
MYYVYILQSEKDKSRYIGATADLQKRVKQHNGHGTKSTKLKTPYILLWYCTFVEKEKAYAFEKYLKSSSGYAFTKKRLI